MPYCAYQESIGAIGNVIPLNEIPNWIDWPVNHRREVLYEEQRYSH